MNSLYETMPYMGIPAKPPTVKVRVTRDGVRVIDHTEAPRYRERGCPSAQIWLPSFRVEPE